MGSAVLVVAIVAVWVVVLLPMFLRGHEKRSELHSAERFAGAMRVLSRRRRGGYDLRPSVERAAVIRRTLGHDLGSPPRVREVRTSEQRRGSRAAARRRGLTVLLAVFAVVLLLALVVGGGAWGVFGLTSVLVLAGLAQLRAMAIADAFVAAPVRRAVEPPAEVREVVPAPREVPAYVPVVRGAGKQIVFDAVSETPVVEKPRVRKVAAPVARQVRAGMPDDFYERPASPPAPEAVRRRPPLLDEVDTDPETLTSGLEALDSILGRRASGE